MPSIWMPLYVGDYLRDTSDLSAAEHGAYLLLIMHYWEKGSLPKDDARLARIARMDASEWSFSRDTIASFFDADWRHSRVEAELVKAKEKYERRANAGREGGKAASERRRSNASSNATSETIANEYQPQPQPPSLSRSPSSEPEPSGVGARDGSADAVGSASAHVSKTNFDRVQSACRDALGELAPQDFVIGPVVALEAEGFDLSKEILPSMLDLARSSRQRIRTWGLLAQKVREKLIAKPAASYQSAGPRLRAVPADPIRNREGLLIKAEAYFRGQWRDSWEGPKPGEAGFPEDVAAEAARMVGASWPPAKAA